MRGNVNLEEGEIPPESSKDINASVTFYISNLPEGITSDEIRGDFGRCGQICDANVARKKDKFGKSFAFVRYKNVRDVEKMVKALCSLNVFGGKMFARVARFSKEDSKARKETKGEAFKYNKAEFPDMGKRPVNHVQNNLWFRETLTGIKEMKKFQLDDKAAALPEEWIGKSVVVAAKNYYRLCKLQECLNIVQGMRMEVRYLGGLKVLISFSNSEKVLEYLKLENIWGEWQG